MTATKLTGAASTVEAEAFQTRYRPDVDGLRAVAVLSVVASHIGLRFSGGGFVGVDVFFVISGFLIGSILLREVEQNGRINYGRFYERRVRRIMPALLAMLLATTAVVYLRLLPKDLINFSEMGATTLLFSSNIFLTHSVGYFDSDAAFNFLTHTWSLGVEEQFYIAFPPALMLFRWMAGKQRLGLMISIVALISFAISIPFAHIAPTGTFYLLPTRIWELLLGTMTFVFARPLGRLPQWVQWILAWTGMAAIALPIIFYSSTTVFPGLSALPPCAGTALLIGTGGTWIHKVLSLRPSVVIGQISYSLYLWHWPINVYNRLYPFPNFGNRHVTNYALFFAPMVIAYVSWRWIETPFRYGRRKPGRTKLFAMMGGASAVLLALFLFVGLTRGAAYRFTPEERQIADYEQNGGSMEHFRVDNCFVMRPTAENLPKWNECLSLDKNKPNYLLIGSSYVAQMYEALQATYPEFHFLQATAPNCPMQPLSAKPTLEGCGALMHFLFADYLLHHHVDAVLFDVEWGEPTPDGLRALVEFFRERGTKTYVMGPQIQYDQPGPALAIAYLREPEKLVVRDHVSGDPAKENEAYRSATESAGGTYLSMFDTLCPDGKCQILAEPGIPMESDRSHLTYAGSVYVARSWRIRLLVKAH